MRLHRLDDMENATDIDSWTFDDLSNIVIEFQEMKAVEGVGNGNVIIMDKDRKKRKTETEEGWEDLEKYEEIEDFSRSVVNPVFNKSYTTVADFVHHREPKQMMRTQKLI